MNFRNNPLLRLTSGSFAAENFGGRKGDVGRTFAERLPVEAERTSTGLFKPRGCRPPTFLTAEQKRGSFVLSSHRVAFQEDRSVRLTCSFVRSCCQKASWPLFTTGQAAGWWVAQRPGLPFGPPHLSSSGPGPSAG